MEHGAELWKTDGTGAGTVLVKDVYPGERSGVSTSFVPFGDYLYFQVGSSTKCTARVRPCLGTVSGSSIVLCEYRITRVPGDVVLRQYFA